MHRQRGSGRPTGCRKSNGFAARQQTKAQLNQIGPRRSTGAYPGETAGPAPNPGSRPWVWILSRVLTRTLCGRSVELGLKMYNRQEPTSCLHRRRSLQAEVEATGSSSGMVVLKVVGGISHSQLQLSCVCDTRFIELHTAAFFGGWCSHFPLLSERPGAARPIMRLPAWITDPAPFFPELLAPRVRRAAILLLTSRRKKSNHSRRLIELTMLYKNRETQFPLSSFTCSRRSSALSFVPVTLMRWPLFALTWQRDENEFSPCTE